MTTRTVSPITSSSGTMKSVTAPSQRILLLLRPDHSEGESGEAKKLDGVPEQEGDSLSFKSH